MADTSKYDFPGLDAGDKLERKYLAHFIDESFNGTASYVRLGKDLEDYSIELNPDVEQTKNIIGENNTNVKGYEPQGSVEPYYAREGDALFEKLYDIINTRATGSELETSVIDCLIDYDNSTNSISVVSATKENVVVVPQSIGGEDGVQIPFEIYYSGNRTAIDGTIINNKFVPAAG